MKTEFEEVITMKNGDEVKTWRIDYYAQGRYKRKYVKAVTSEAALKKGRVNRSVVDICIVEHEGQ